MGNFSYSNVRMRERLSIFTSAAEYPFIFGADSGFECFQQNYINPQFRSVFKSIIRSDYFEILKIK